MSMRPSTQFAHAGRLASSSVRITNVPVHRASTVLFDTLAEADAKGRAVATGDAHSSTYGTAGTPSTLALMDTLAEIEGGGHDCAAALMPSVLAAITTALLALVEPGEHVLVPDSVYGPTRAFCKGLLSRIGVEVTFYDPNIAAGIEALLKPKTRAIYLESPGSYTFEIQDVPAICAIARARGIHTIIDNAWASPVFSRPFDWGVDCSVLPFTKYWSGHSDVLMGAVVARREVWPRVWAMVRQLGQCVGGDDAYLILRGLRTAGVRMEQHQANALAVAHWLSARPEVVRVLHPALPSHPQHALWKRDFTGASGLFSFDLSAQALGGMAAGFNKATAALCEGRRHFGIGYSWGGYESLIMPARIEESRSVSPWKGGALIRIHVGLEDPRDLIADLEEGFAAMARVIAE